MDSTFPFDTVARETREVLRGLRSDNRLLEGVVEVNAQTVATYVGHKLGTKEGPYTPSIQRAVNETLWQFVRAGMLNPIQVNVGHGPVDHSSFYFTPAGEEWRRGSTTPNPLADDYVVWLRKDAPVFSDEPALVFVEARKAKAAGLLRASMILIGLSAECVVQRLFDDGIASGRVKDKQAKAKRYQAQGVQGDVETAMQGLEAAKSMRAGEAASWTIAANAYRKMRNDCAHDAGYQPDPSEVESGFFAWTHFVKLSDKAWKLLR